jgi:hypothetical protein
MFALKTLYFYNQTILRPQSIQGKDGIVLVYYVKSQQLL